MSNNLLQRIKAVAWIELGQELEVEELEVSLIPLGLEVRGIVITRPDNPRSLAEDRCAGPKPRLEFQYFAA